MIYNGLILLSKEVLCKESSKMTMKKQAWKKTEASHKESNKMLMKKQALK
jgi:hypothetical protein